MAQATYTSPQITLATRKIAFERLAEFILHCDAYNVTHITITTNADNSLTITVNGPFSEDVSIFGLV